MQEIFDSQTRIAFISCMLIIYVTLTRLILSTGDLFLQLQFRLTIHVYSEFDVGLCVTPHPMLPRC